VSQQSNKKHKLTKIDVNEVSLVDRGAIGEVFSIIKSENLNKENIEKFLKQYYNQSQTVNKTSNSSSSELINKLKDLNEDEFVTAMQDLLKKYEEINKNEGGNNEMNEKEVQEIVTKAIQDSLAPLSENFKEVNKSVKSLSDEINKVKESVKEDPKKDPKDSTKESKGDSKTGDKDGDVAKAMNAMSSALDNMVTKLGVVNDIQKSVSDITEKVEAISKSANPSNLAPDADPAKSTVTKSQEVKWKSFVTPQQ